MKPEDEIVELKATIASIRNELDIIKRNLQLKSISEQEFDECKERIDFLEDQVAMFKHMNDVKGITTRPDYPPYTPYVIPTPTPSKFTPSGYLRCESNLNCDGRN